MKYKHRDELPFMITPEEFAKIMRISQAKAYDFLRKNKDLPRIKIGAKTMIPKEGFLQWIQQEGQYKASQETLRMCLPRKQEKKKMAGKKRR